MAVDLEEIVQASGVEGGGAMEVRWVVVARIGRKGGVAVGEGGSSWVAEKKGGKITRRFCCPGMSIACDRGPCRCSLHCICW